jgi:hypothetical protein
LSLKAAQPSAAIGRFARVEVMPQPVAPADVAARPPGLIEIALPDGTTVRVDAGIDPRALRRVLAEDPFSGALFAFRGKRGGLIKLLPAYALSSASRT